jgi:hypothetical protein
MHKFSKNWKPSQNCKRQNGDCSKLHSEGPQILGATAENLVAWAPGIRAPLLKTV